MAGSIQLGYNPYYRKATALEKCLRNTSLQKNIRKKEICSIHIMLALTTLPSSPGKEKRIEILYKIN